MFLSPCHTASIEQDLQYWRIVQFTTLTNGQMCLQSSTMSGWSRPLTPWIISSCFRLLNSISSESVNEIYSELRPEICFLRSEWPWPLEDQTLITLSWRRMSECLCQVWRNVLEALQGGTAFTGKSGRLAGIKMDSGLKQNLILTNGGEMLRSLLELMRPSPLWFSLTHSALQLNVWQRRPLRKKEANRCWEDSQSVQRLGVLNQSVTKRSQTDTYLYEL